MTDKQAISLIADRAEKMANNPIVQRLILNNGITDKSEVQKFIYNLAIATLYGNGEK